MSLARHNYSAPSEAAINSQIALEYSASYTYTALAAYFARDDVSLPGLRKFFAESSDEEREHAQKFIDYQTKRGGRVQFENLPAPDTEWKSALNALEAALALEKKVNEALLRITKVADENNDPHLGDFIESEFLDEQVESLNKLANMLTQLKRAGTDGLGLYLFDQDLLKKQ